MLNVLCFVGFILVAFVAKCGEKDPCYCFMENSLVAVYACVVIDFH